RYQGNFLIHNTILGDENTAIDELTRQTATVENQAAAAAATAIPENGDLKGMVRGVKDGAEIEAITRTLMQTGWNRKRAAEILNISYKAMLYKVRQYGIKPPRNRSLHFVDKDN